MEPQFLQVGEATPNVDVVILQFPAGNFSIADGDIEAINGDKVFYQIGTEGGSSGSPLLNLDCVALAMHNAGQVLRAVSQQAIRRATALSAVIKAYLEERPEVDPEAATAKKPTRFLLQNFKRWACNGICEWVSRLCVSECTINICCAFASYVLNTCTYICSEINTCFWQTLKWLIIEIIIDTSDISVWIINLDRRTSERQEQQFWRLLRNRRGSDSRHEYHTETSSAQTMSHLSASGLCALPDDVIGIACGSDGLRAVSLRSAAPLSGRLRSRKRVESGVRCALGHTAAGSWGKERSFFGRAKEELSIGWCRCVAARANGSKSSVYAAKLSENNLGDLVVCNTRVLLGDHENDMRLYAFDVSAEHSIRAVGTVDVRADCVQALRGHSPRRRHSRRLRRTLRQLSVSAPPRRTATRAARAHRTHEPASSPVLRRTAARRRIQRRHSHQWNRLAWHKWRAAHAPASAPRLECQC